MSQQHPACSLMSPLSDITPSHWSPVSSILWADVSLTWQISWPAISCPPLIMWSHDPTKPQPLSRGSIIARWGFITCHSSPADSKHHQLCYLKSVSLQFKKMELELLFVPWKSWELGASDILLIKYIWEIMQLLCILVNIHKDFPQSDRYIGMGYHNKQISIS